jgi:hypothetical protein
MQVDIEELNNSKQVTFERVGTLRGKIEMSVDIEELKRLDREATQGPWYVAHGGFAEYDEGFSIGSKIEGTGVVAECWPCSTDADHRRRLLADCKMMIHIRNHLPAIIAELESLRTQARKPDARRLAEVVVDKSHIWIGLPPNGMKDVITSIIERELSRDGA